MRLDQEQKRRSCCIPKSRCHIDRRRRSFPIHGLSCSIYSTSIIQLHNNVCPHVQTHIGDLLEIYIRWEENPVTRRETH